MGYNQFAATVVASLSAPARQRFRFDIQSISGFEAQPASRRCHLLQEHIAPCSVSATYWGGDPLHLRARLLASHTAIQYGVTMVVLDLGWVSLDLECSTSLPGQ